MKQFNNSFATLKLREDVDEMSTTGAGEAYLPGLDVPEKKYKGVSERIDTITLADFKSIVEKYQRGIRRKEDVIDAYSKLSPSDQDSAKSYMRGIKEDTLSGYKQNKGFKPGHTKDTGGFQYKDLWDVNEGYITGAKVKVTADGNIHYNDIGKVVDYSNGAYTVQFDDDTIGTYQANQLTKPQSVKDFEDKPELELNETYSRFKKETVTRSKEQQMHEAMKLVRKKLHEADKVMTYVKTMKEELGLQEYKKHTNKLMEKLQVSISEIYKKYKQIK